MNRSDKIKLVLFIAFLLFIIPFGIYRNAELNKKIVEAENLAGRRFNYNEARNYLINND